MHFDTEFTVVFIACVTLALGAVTRWVAQRTRFPYTIAMLLLGLGAGVALQQVGGDGPALVAVLARGASISPHLIIFAFLPALVFESAFAMDYYAFRKDVGAITLLAVPALLVSTAAVGALMVGLTGSSWGWGWSTALVFGALISATDPVAVVAILRELGAPKRLGVLIEGESLLNDGSSIVVFSVLVGLLASPGAGIDIGATVVEFFKVVTGGLGVGLVLLCVVAYAVSRLFNDATSEITLTLVLAYACMLVAEGMLHVSGIMAVVLAGLWMGGPGRTRVSPEVEHFLHEFLELLSFIANTLIFFLVGLVIAAQVVGHAGWMDIGLIVVAYVGIMIIRFVINFAFMPAIALVGDPITRGEAAVMSWSGLRGAVSLALALIVSQNPDIDPVLREQILLITAGVVFLTITLNGWTVGPLLSRLGFDKPPLTEQVAQLNARAGALDSVRRRIDDVSQSRELRSVEWGEVKRELEQRRDVLERQLEAAREQLGSASADERAVGYWRQALNIERRAYWAAFGKGTLGAAATTILDLEIERQLDRLEHGEHAPPDTRLATLRGLRSLTRRRHRRDRAFGPLEFDRLALLYDISRAEAMAADGVIGWLDALEGAEPAAVAEIERVYRGYAHGGKERVEDLRANLPEITRAIETRLARRIELNFERDEVKQLARSGAIDEGTEHAALEVVEGQMKRLRGRPRALALPATAELCRATPLFAALDEATIHELAEITVEQVVARDELLFAEGDRGDSMFIIARGAARVVKDVRGEPTTLNVLGGGDIVGEMSLLMGAPRTATVRAATTLTVGKIGRDDFDRLMHNHPDVRDRIWAAFARRRLFNFLRNDPRYAQLDHDARTSWAADARHVLAGDGEGIDPADAGYLFAVLGAVDDSGLERAAPALIGVVPGQRYRAVGETRLLLLPGLERAFSSPATSTRS